MAGSAIGPVRASAGRRDHRRGAGRLLSAALVIAGAAALVGAAASPPARADTTRSFQATASAEGVRITGVAGGAPVTDTPFDAGSPVSQATLDSLGTSRAYASAAFPGDLLVSLPGLVAGLSKGQATPPNYPVIATSDRVTQPDAEVASPGLSMSAHSSDVRSTATTVVGAITTTAAAESRPDGTITSESESTITGFASDLIKMADLRSTAAVVLRPDGTVTRQSTFSVSGLEVAGVAVAVTRDGIVLGSDTAPSPSSADLSKALEQAGVRLKLLEAVETEDGIVGQGLQVIFIRDTGSSVTPFGVEFRFGRAVASVQHTGADALAGPLAPSSPGSGAAVGSVDSAGPVGALPVLGPLPVAGGEITTGALGPESVALPAVLPAGDLFSPVGAATRFDTRDLYLLLAAMAAMAGAGGYAVANFGVRTR